MMEIFPHQVEADSKKYCGCQQYVLYNGKGYDIFVSWAICGSA